MKPKRTRRLRKIVVPKNCPFCAAKSEPSFREAEKLSHYVSERGKILAHTRTGLCSKHQRQVARAIKHARHLAMMPFVNELY